MIITESQLREIIEEETLIYRALQEGLLDEGIADELKRLAVRYGLPLAAVLSIWTSTMKGDPIQISPEAEATGLNQDVAAQVVQDLPVERPAEKRTQAEIKDFLDNATEQDLSPKEFDAIVMLQNAFNKLLGQHLSQEELLFQWFGNSPDEQERILGQDKYMTDQQKTEIKYNLEQIKAKMSPLKIISTPPSFDVPKAPTGMA